MGPRQGNQGYGFPTLAPRQRHAGIFAALREGRRGDEEILFFGRNNSIIQGKHIGLPVQGGAKN
jgi:hypothetical protein